MAESQRKDRTEEERPSDAWSPQSKLPTPTPRDGISFRWIRTAQLGQSDNTNVSQAFRDGWVACTQEDHKELKMISDLGSKFEGNIEVGGLLLCKIPTERMNARAKYFADMNENQMVSVDQNFMNENDSRMPLLQPDRKTRTTFGRGG